MRVRLKKQAGYADSDTRTTQLSHLMTTTAGGCAKGDSALQRMSDIKNSRQAATEPVHG